MDFYTAISITAIASLILVLTIYGVMLSNLSQSEKFPTVQNACPTFWGIDEKQNCLNTSNVNNISGGVPENTPGVLPTNNGFSPNHTGWDSGAYKGLSGVCAKRQWTIDNGNIIWDGVSNYNSC